MLPACLRVVLFKLVIYIYYLQLYSNQTAVGAGIVKYFSEPNAVQREQLFIVSKLWNTEYENVFLFIIHNNIVCR